MFSWGFNYIESSGERVSEVCKMIEINILTIKKKKINSGTPCGWCGEIFKEGEDLVRDAEAGLMHRKC